MAQIVVRTSDPFAVTLVCKWADHHDVKTMAVGRPDDHYLVRVILYGIDDTDPLFHEFGRITQASYKGGECPWVPSTIDPEELQDIVIEEASEDWWRACFVAIPNVSLGGSSSIRALTALCRDFGIDLSRLTPGDSGSEERILVHVTTEAKRACPECRGAGITFEQEDVKSCETCGGAGTL